MSCNHTVETFYLKPELISKHPAADTLSVLQIADTQYVYIGKTEEWLPKIGKLVAWVPPDSVVDRSLPQFSFLDKDRVKAKRLRGVVSYGLLVEAPEELCEGQDAAEALKVMHYEPELAKAAGGARGGFFGGNELANPPQGSYPKYDVDNFLRYGKLLFQPGEKIFCSEKIHGANGRWLIQNDKLFCGSRIEWKAEFSKPPKLSLEELKTKVGDEEKAKEIWERAVVNFQPKRNLWWQALSATPSLYEALSKLSDHCFYGEVYGQVQNLKYGTKQGEVRIAIFDILKPDGSWFNAPDTYLFCMENGIPHVPVIGNGMEFDWDEVMKLKEGPSMIQGANHYREGVVIVPIKERWDPKLGRVKLKLINPEYLEKN